MPALGTILVVEDDGATREFIAGILSDEGYTVRLMSDGVDDKAALAEGQPDLILLDYHLPAANGLTFARRIRSIGITVPIVLMTIDSHPPDHPDMVNIASCFLKPFELDELLACVATHIRVAQAVELGPNGETSKRYKKRPTSISGACSYAESAGGLSVCS